MVAVTRPFVLPLSCQSSPPVQRRVGAAFIFAQSEAEGISRRVFPIFPKLQMHILPKFLLIFFDPLIPNNHPFSSGGDSVDFVSARRNVELQPRLLQLWQQQHSHDRREGQLKKVSFVLCYLAHQTIKKGPQQLGLLGRERKKHGKYYP